MLDEFETLYLEAVQEYLDEYGTRFARNNIHIFAEDRLALSDFVRADGNMICSECSKEYWHHPSSEDRSWDDQPFLRVLCDGTLVKL